MTIRNAKHGKHTCLDIDIVLSCSSHLIYDRKPSIAYSVNSLCYVHIYLRAPYGVYFANKKTPVQFYGARPVTGTFFQLFTHRTVLGEIKVLFKISRRQYGVL